MMCMGHTDRPPFHGKDRIGIILFLRNFRDACDAVGNAEGAAIFLFQFDVSAEVLTVIRRGLPMRSGNAPGGSIPSFPRVLKVLLKEYLDVTVLNDRLRALQTAMKHSWEMDNYFSNRMVDLNGKLGGVKFATTANTLSRTPKVAGTPTPAPSQSLARGIHALVPAETQALYIASATVTPSEAGEYEMGVGVGPRVSPPIT